MKSKGLAILAAVTLVVLIAAIWSTLERGRRTAAAAAPGGLHPGLIDRVNEISKIAIRTPRHGFTIQRAGEADWRVPERGGYPVKFETVKQAVVGIASMRILEAKTAKAELHPKLHLKAPEDGGKGTSMTLTDGQGNDLAAIVVGKTKVSPTTKEPGIHYVRKADQAQSWLAAGRVEAWETIDRWLDNEMPTIARQRVRAATTSQPDGDAITVARTDPDGRDFTVRDIPEGWKMLHATAGNALGSALGFLSFEDVAPIEKIDFANPNMALFKTFDGLSLLVTMVERDSQFWLHFDAEFAAEDVQTEGLSEAQMKAMKSADEVRAEVDRINGRFAPWAYRVAKYKADDFMTARDALLMKDDGKGKDKGG
ncbi:MAG: DUF4340 domain-containing protein [Alphaproteobacteria bacterium]|nr:DUF4340 domain-containing protein [Alphaproteobacteria bacterium]MDP6565104.1 DUF4340 domain-containing protein [Alphaproteobacteria bacterium]MDP6816069.1 DUF4340 domain-containing protein [Alphaproteobacteria bacterium]